MLEENIMHLTAALDRLTAAINKAQGTPEDKVPGKPQITMAGGQPVVGQSSAQPTTKTISPSDVGKSSSGAASDTQPSGAPSDSGAIDYDKVIFPLVTAAVAAGKKPAVLALIEAYKPGAKKLREAVTEAQYAEVKAKLEAIIGG